MSALSGPDRNAKNHLADLSFLVNEGRPLLSQVTRISEGLYSHMDSKPTNAQAELEFYWWSLL